MGLGDGGEAGAGTVDAIRDAEVYIGYGIAREAFLAAPGLRWVHSAGVGVRGALFPELLASEVVLTNSRGVQSKAMAETALAALLHFARGLDHAVRAQARAQWLPGPFDACVGIGELRGARLGLIGYGSLGRAVADRAGALGMRVTAVRRRTAGFSDSQEAEHVRVLSGAEGLDEVLRASAYVVVCLPETPETQALLGHDELARLAPGTVLVNLSRGPVIDEDALIAALPRLRGVALDVFAREPLEASSPFWSAPNVLITPHVSATTPHHWERQTALVLDNLDRYLRGRPLLNTVDKRIGY
ncbi:Glyoxylate reductase (NADP(+)) [Streptomyces sp. ACT-1]|nr:Glyoxylate reductase (NADP(+)) [Streptomyces sp. ACT-1]